MNRWVCRGFRFGFALSLLFTAPSALAQEPQVGDRIGSEVEALKEAIQETKAEFKTMKALYDGKINELEGRLKKLEEAPAAPPPPPRRGPQAPRLGGAALLLDISAVGDFVANIGIKSDDLNPLRNRIFPREIELAFQGVVDPFISADLFLEVGEEEPGKLEVGLDEAYGTLLALPLGLQARFGFFRVPFGRINLVHPHVLPQVTRPNVLRRFFGEEGLVETGFALNTLLPHPLHEEGVFEPWIGIFNGDNEESFGQGSFRRPLGILHLKNFFQLTDDSALQVGFSGATGKSEEARRTYLYGLDLTYKWKPLDRPFTSLTLQGELLFSHRKAEVDLDRGTVEQSFDRYGFYVFGDYRLSRRWFGGMRFDWSQFPKERGTREWALSPVLTFWPSEFSQFRVQYTFTNRNFGRDAHEIFLQTSFSLGPHGPHPF